MQARKSDYLAEVKAVDDSGVRKAGRCDGMLQLSARAQQIAGKVGVCAYGGDDSDFSPVRGNGTMNTCLYEARLWGGGRVSGEPFVALTEPGVRGILEVPHGQCRG